jgi:hypothetical protein
MMNRHTRRITEIFGLLFDAWRLRFSLKNQLTPPPPQQSFAVVCQWAVYSLDAELLTFDSSFQSLSKKGIPIAHPVIF